jgi:uncharacterized lipoprotein YddW (UPF0748 family)
MTTALRAIRTASAQAGAQRRDPRLEVCLSSAAEHYRAAVRATKGGRPWDAVRSAEAVTATLTEAYARVQSPRPGEFRAVWCHSAYGIPGWTWEQSLTALRRAGFKAVVPNMLWGGIADYFSTVLPVSDQARARGDQIAQCLAAARKSGVEVHVWKVNWNLGTAPESFVARLRAQGRLQMDAQGGERPWLCPSDPANLALERDSMLEVARRYPVDGIHFDYIRYPDGDSCYCSGCRQRFETSAPAPTTAWPSEVLRGGPLRARFNEFRRSNITRLVRAVSDEVRRLPRKVRISAAVFPNWPACRDEVAQDWAQWVRDGLLDFVCPMDYTASTREFRTRLGVQRTAVDGRIPLYPGIGVSAPGLDVAQVIGQVRAAREAGLGGFILFNYDARTAREILPAMALGLTRAGRSPSQQRPPVR